MSVEPSFRVGFAAYSSGDKKKKIPQVFLQRPSPMLVPLGCVCLMMGERPNFGFDREGKDRGMNVSWSITREGVYVGVSGWGGAIFW